MCVCVNNCSLNIFCDIGLFDWFEQLIKQMIFVLKTIKNTEIVRKLHDSLCVENHGKKLAMKSFSPTKWITGNDILRRLVRAWPIFACMSNIITNEREQRQIDPKYQLLEGFDTISKPQSFRSGLNPASTVLNQMATSLGSLESDPCATSHGYAGILVYPFTWTFEGLVSV